MNRLREAASGLEEPGGTEGSRSACYRPTIFHPEMESRPGGSLDLDQRLREKLGTSRLRNNRVDGDPVRHDDLFCDVFFSRNECGGSNQFLASFPIAASGGAEWQSRNQLRYGTSNCETR
jgi:hypothetical protein